MMDDPDLRDSYEERKERAIRDAAEALWGYLYFHEVIPHPMNMTPGLRQKYEVGGSCHEQPTT